MTSDCPEPEVWRELLAGRLAEDRFEVLAGHLEDCPLCRQRVDQEARATASRKPDQNGPHDSGLSKVLEKLRRTVPTPTPADSEVDAVLRQLDAPSNESYIGRLGRFEVQRVLGKGGFGVVLRAFDPNLGRPVALKVLTPHLAANVLARKRFTREAKAGAAIKNENVVAIHDVGAFKDEWAYFVMEYVEGQSLKEKLERSGPLSVVEILRIGQQIARGLAAAHAHGLVHRDVKPANILLENGVERIKLTDFGLVLAADGDLRLSVPGSLAGTPEYMAPEQYRGEPVDHHADLFSLGTVLYELCTGQSPFRASTPAAILKRVCEDTPRSIRSINPSIPNWLEALIGKLHAKAPVQRYQSAAEVADLLEQCLRYVQQPEGEPNLPAGLLALAGANKKEGDMDPKLAEQLHRQNRLLKMLALAAGLLLVVVLAVVTLVVVLGKQSHDERLALTNQDTEQTGNTKDSRQSPDAPVPKDTTPRTKPRTPKRPAPHLRELKKGTYKGEARVVSGRQANIKTETKGIITLKIQSIDEQGNVKAEAALSEGLAAMGLFGEGKLTGKLDKQKGILKLQGILIEETVSTFANQTRKTTWKYDFESTAELKEQGLKGTYTWGRKTGFNSEGKALIKITGNFEATLQEEDHN